MAHHGVDVRFIPLGSTDRSIDATIHADWCEERLAEISAIFEVADIEFRLAEIEPTRYDDKLNLDVPPGNDPDGIETQRQSLAEQYPHELVVFVRYFGGDSRYKAFHYSSVEADYVVAEPRSDAWLLAHEFGHFFGLPHTFDDGLKDQLANTKGVPARIELLKKVLEQAIADKKVVWFDALTFLDGDRSVVSDTPPDVSPPPFQPNDKPGEESAPGSPASIKFDIEPIQWVDAADVTITLAPDKLNLMSYFTFTERPHLSRDQARVVTALIRTGKRRRLLQRA